MVAFVSILPRVGNELVDGRDFWVKALFMSAYHQRAQRICDHSVRPICDRRLPIWPMA